MDVTWAAAVAGLLGVLVGAGAVAASRWSERRPEPLGPVGDDLPSGAADVLAVIPSAAVVLDVADVVVRASAAAHAFGLVRDTELVHDELAGMVASVRRDGEIRDAEVVLPRSPFALPGPDGAGTLVAGVRVAPLGSLHVLLLVEDRTAARRLEEVRRDFVANVSHELKTPVSAIALLAETMDDAAEDPAAVRRFAQRMTRESQRLAALVQEIVQLSRLQDADARHRPVPVDVDEAVLEAVDRTRLVAEGRGVRIVTQLSGEGEGDGARGGTPAEVWGDRELVVTAVRNLVDNGVHYSDAGTRVAVVVSVVDERVEVVVRDQGIGIPEAEAGRVFERFYRLDPARSRSTGGTGLGLSIVKHVAANHGGDVALWSRPGEGSTFTLRLPLRRADADEQVAAS
ncbi:ATP-binding protein [Pseudokineococcus basanitobsidens]|uniref:Sensor-like histidine kinase SenX3 n=1 Tax=Pseudokineococcus basanitobsidens TaxID=1926649 RepID=A0ABU8RGR4_9ACTN